MNKETIALLESIKVVPAEDDSEGNTCCKMKVSDYRKIYQVIDLLKQQPTEVHKALEPIANWYGGGTEGNRSDIEIIIDAVADLQKDRAELLLLKQQPTAGDNKDKFHQRIAEQRQRVALDLAAEIQLLEKQLDRAEARIGAMYAGSLSPESRLNGYKIVVANLREECQELKKAEASKTDLLAALEQIRDLETECCPRCEGNGRLYADGKAHLMSEYADTILCGNCGGSGRILPEDAQGIAEAAIAKVEEKI